MTTRDEIDRLKWFHAIDLDGRATPGRIPPSQPPNFTLFGIYRFLEHIRVDGASVIDVGTMDGLMAFALARLGATEVVATDLWDRRQFRLAREALGLEGRVEYRTGLDIRDFERELGTHRFDLMVFAGVLYHLISPLEYLLHCRRQLRHGGLLLMETCFDPAAEGVSLTFNMGMPEPLFMEPTTYFLPSQAALLAMLRTACFDCLGVVRLKHGSNRVSVLARAVRPSEARHKTELQRRHDVYVDKPDHFAYGDLFHALEHRALEPANAHYDGPVDLDEDLDIRSYRPRVPCQPVWTAP